MSKKVKIKVKPGKAKIKLKSGGDAFPLSARDLRRLLGAALATGAGQLASPPGWASLPAAADPGESATPRQLAAAPDEDGGTG